MLIHAQLLQDKFDTASKRVRILEQTFFLSCTCSQECVCELFEIVGYSVVLHGLLKAASDNCDQCGGKIAYRCTDTSWLRCRKYHATWRVANVKLKAAREQISCKEPLLRAIQWLSEHLLNPLFVRRLDTCIANTCECTVACVRLL